MIDREPEIRDTDASSSQDFGLESQIRFEDVTFRYPTAPEEVRAVLQRVSFSIEAGRTTAIVGASGCGKSTIVQLIQRLYDPYEGSVLFDNHNIASIGLKTLRENIGYVSQEPSLIIGSIRDNLKFGNQSATEDDFWTALQLANAA